MMAWQDQLRPASFRGVAFKVESHEAAGGRRAITHEYPLRDKPFSEDMGKRAGDFNVEAYVLGDDYFSQRDALLKAISQAGAGDLVHPYLGTLSVICDSWRLRETVAEGRMARFTLAFKESGEDTFPSDSVDAISTASIKADAAQSSAIADFASKFSLDGMPDFTIADATAILTEASNDIGDITKQASSLTSGAVGFLSTVNTFQSSLTELIRIPTDLASNLWGLVQSAVTMFDSPLDAVENLFDLFDFGSDQEPISQTTAVRVQQQANRTAINNLVQRAAMVEAARAAPQATYETEDQANNVSDTLTDALDDQMQTPDTDDDVYTSLQDVRTTVVEGVPPPDVALPALTTITPQITTPSLVLAYSLYTDASRDIEICSRNSIRWPGFVPGLQPLRVIVDA